MTEKPQSWKAKCRACGWSGSSENIHANSKDAFMHCPHCESILIDEVDEEFDNTAPGFLLRAAAIMEERGNTYDQKGGERSMGKTVQAFNAITGHRLSEADGWLLMECLKNVRQWQRPEFHQDSADDGVAYSALKAEALAHA